MSKKSSVAKDYKLTTWEAYNYILHGLVKESIEIFNLDPKVKETAFKIWAEYLRRHEAAFFNNKEEVLPKLPACFKDRDFQLLTNMLNECKRKLDSEEVDGNITVEGEKCVDLEISRIDKKFLKADNNTILSQNLELKKVHRKDMLKKYDKQKLARSVLFIIVYCAINQHDPSIQISDVLRMIREGHLSYFECRHFLPDHLSEDEKSNIKKIYTKFPDYLTYTSFTIALQQLTFFCGFDLNPPNFYVLVERYVTELALPKTIYIFIEKLFSLCPTDFEFSDCWGTGTPFYEGRAMAYIMFVLKLLFGLNGVTEVAMSKSAKAFNDFVEKEQRGFKQKLFVWTEWVEYFTARKLLLMKHFENDYFLNEHEYCDYSNKSSEHYLNLHERLLENKYERTAVKIDAEGVKTGKKFAPREHTDKVGLAKAAKAMTDIRKKSEPIFKFPPSLTPSKTNLEVLMENEDVAIPPILKDDYRERNIEYLLNTTKIRGKCSKKGFKLKTIEAPCNDSTSFINNKKNDLKFMNFKKINYYKFDELDLKLDTETFLNEIETEFNQKEINKETIKDDPTIKQEINDLKQYTRELLREKRKTHESNDVHMFNEIESSSDSEPDDETAITVHRPNFNYWTFLEYPHYITQELYDYLSPNFPESFKWLLENGSILLDMQPVHLYFQLLAIETQFLYVLKPMHKVKDELVFQDVSRLGSGIRSTVKHLNKRFKDGRITN